MKPVKASPQTTRLQKFRALGLTLLLSVTMIFGLFMILVSPAQASENNEVKKNDVISGTDTEANQLAIPLLDEPESLSIYWDNFAVAGAGNADFAHFTAVTVRNDHEIWFGGNADASGSGSLQVAGYNYATDTWAAYYVVYTPSSDPSIIQAIAFDENDNLWLATDNGVFNGVFNQALGTWSFTPFGTSQLVDDVRAVVVDGADIWFGTVGGGAARYTPGDPEPWEVYSRTGSGNDQICSNDVYSIAVQDDSNIWFGTDDGFCQLDKNAEPDEWFYYLNGSGVDVSDIAIDAEGNVWAVRPGYGISVLTPSESWTNYTEANSDLTNEGSVWSITIDSTQRKWIGFQGYGIDVVSADNQDWGNFNESTETNQIGGDIVNDVIEATNGDIWLAIGPNAYSEFASQGVTAISGLTVTNNSPTQSGNSTIFTATVTYGSGEIYTWDFGDGSAVGTGAIVTHTYQAAGNYTAVITASNSANRVTTTVPVTITEWITGLAVSNNSPTISGDSTLLTATIETGSNVAFTWSLGDGSYDNGSQVTHIYPTVGVYTAVVTASNSVNSLTATTTITVADTPIVDLTATNSSPAYVNSSIAFTATIASGSNVNYAWNFGDGATTVGANPEHTYAAAGVYTTIVTATNPINTLTTTTTVQVVGPPVSTTLAILGNGTVAANGQQSIMIQVTALDALGQAIPDASIVLTSTSPVAFVQPALPTNQDGQTIGQVTSTHIGTADIGAVVDGLLVGDTVTVTFMGPDLALSMSGPVQTLTGYPIVYDITIANQGLLTATGVIVTDTLPATLISPTHTAPYSTSYDPVAHTLVWDVGTLAPGALTTFTVQANVPYAANAGSFITNTLTGSLDELDLNSNNNLALQATMLEASAPLLDINPETVNFSLQPGTSYSATLTIHNQGTAPLTDLSISPSAYAWITFSPTSVTSLGINQTFTFTIQATVPTTQSYGFYLQEVRLTSSNHPTMTVDVEVYVHPELSDVTIAVSNTMGSNVAGATVSFTTDRAWVRFVNGTSSGTQSIVYNATTNSNGIAVIQQMEVGDYEYTVSANRHLPANDAVTISEITSFIAVTLQALPTLVFEPDQANLSILAGEPVYYMFQVRNTGPGHAEGFSIETPSELPWLSSGLPYSVTQLDAGEAMSVTLFLTPPASSEPVTYVDYEVVVDALYVQAATLALTINVVPTTTGTLEFVVTDDANQPLPETTITLIDQNGRTVNDVGGSYVVYDWYTATTDISGTATLPELTLSEYTYYAEADSYYAKVGTIHVQPGEPDEGLGINREAVALTFDPFHYSWAVEETTITDTYAITIEVTYESDIARPALFISPEMICPPESGGSDDGAWLIANMGAYTMTNLLVAVDYPDFSFVVNGGNPSASVLGVGQAITMPFTASSSNPSEQPWLGTARVQATYLAGTTPVTYYASAPIRRCGYPGNSDGWSWEWNGQSVIGHTGGGGGFIPRPYGAPPPPPRSDHEIAKLILSGEATLERQAFNARLVLDSQVPTNITNVNIHLEFKDENGQTVGSGFSITPTVPTDLGTLPAGGQLAGAWLIVPGDLGITKTNGVVYQVRAYIEYTLGGQNYVLVTLPQPLIIYPQPYVRLGFNHSQPDANGDFYLEVTAQNDGYGIARNLTLDLSQVTVLGDLDGNGRSLLFELVETTVNGVAQTPEYVFRFGNIAPGAVMTGQWFIKVSTSDGMLLENPVITGFSVSCKHLRYQGLELSELINCGEINQLFLSTYCQGLYCQADKNINIGGPINTANGNYFYAQSTPGMPTVGSELGLTWVYNSLNSGAYPSLAPYSSTLGLGWGHNHDVHLEFDQTNVVVLRGPDGSPIYFEKVRDGYRAAPGILATLTREETSPGQYEYTATTHHQFTYVFDDAGRLLFQADPHGNIITYTYTVQGQLERVEDSISGRYLDFSYDLGGRLQAVTDSTDRETLFGYNSLGQLTTITDTRQAVWQYEYTALNSGIYILSHVIDPEGRTIEQTGFDEVGRAITQTYRGQTFNIVYYSDGRRLVLDGAGHQTVYVYNQQNLLVAAADLADPEHMVRLVHDADYNLIYGQDQNGNITRGERTPFGYPTLFVNALGDETHYEYDGQNHLTQFTDALSRTTTYGYEGNTLISTTNALDQVVYYTYNSYGQATSETDENTHTTEYGYDALGQLTVITNAVGLTTTYGYDAAGRLITVTETTGKVTVYTYDAVDYLLQMTENYLSGQPQNYLNEYNLITQYGYDEAGYLTAVTDTLGHVNLTLYDAFGRVRASVTNYDGTTPSNELCASFVDPNPEYNLCTLTAYDAAGRVISSTNPEGRVTRTFYDVQGRIRATIQNWSGSITDVADIAQCLSLSPERTTDLCTLYAYDAVGNTILVTDTVGRMTRTFFDELNRTIATIQNWSGSINSREALSQCLNLPDRRDHDICSFTAYDEVGNTIITTNTVGVMNRNFYDSLNRLVVSVQNWNPLTLEGPADCLLTPHNMVAENICTVYGYDDAGNRVTSTNALGQTALTVYDTADRPIISVQNWDGTTLIDEPADCSFDLDATVNLCQITLYNDLGQRSGTQNALGYLTTFAYDSLGRLVTTTRYLDGTPVQIVSHYDALGNVISQTDARQNSSFSFYDSLNRQVASISAGGIVMTRTYDVAGRVISTTNNLGHMTLSSYDDLGRLVQSKDAEGNTTSYTFNVLGQQLVMTDANGIRSSYEYDGLGRQTAITQNDTGGTASADANVTTRYVYDVQGNQVAVINAHHITVTFTVYDALNRPVAVRDALNQTTHTVYNALGQTVVITDANGAVTRCEYDELSRVQTILYQSDGDTVTYAYDALGRRTVMTDSLGVTVYGYDELSRLTVITDSLGATLHYAYDVVGNRTGLTYPDGKVVTYTYNVDNRLTQVEDWQSNHTTYEYDTVGRLITMTLPNGVVMVNTYDNANRLTGRTYTAPDATNLASYAYLLDGMGQKQVITETVLSPGYISEIEAFVEQNGLLVLEAESGRAGSGGTHSWISQTVQTGYVGDSYLRGLPDVGAIYTTADLADSPRMDYPIAVNTADHYTVWVRGMAGAASGDSLHVGLEGESTASSANLTGFSQDWSWSSLTMSQTTATLPLTATGTFSLNLWLREDGVRVDRLLLVTDTNYVPTGEGPAAAVMQVVTQTVPPAPHYQVTTLSYDGLYRLTEANYSGTLEAVYSYGYDVLGNRLVQTTTITSTEVITYRYDSANRLVESVVQGGETTHYEWGRMNRLITTTVASNLSRVYGYSQDGELISAVVDGLLTTFSYNGNGQRLLMSVAGQVTSYTLDYAGPGQRILWEQRAGEMKHYLYGLACLGEFVTDSTTATTEWRYYQHDGNSLVRQTTNSQAEVTLAWTFSPEGAVILGEEGPVTHLGCEGDAVYDWSTGLIFKRGRYFDPSTGIWLSMAPALVWQRGQRLNRRQRRQYDKQRRIYILFLLLFVMLLLAGCNPEPDPTPPGPTPTTTPCPTPTTAPTPLPTMPAPSSPTPILTSTPRPPTPIPPTSTPTPTQEPFGNPMYNAEQTGYYDIGLPNSGPHYGIDVIGDPYDVLASTRGTVRVADECSPNCTVPVGTEFTEHNNWGTGNVVIVEHRQDELPSWLIDKLGLTASQSLFLQYQHLASIAVQGGNAVQLGTPLGIMGNTGRSDAIHLHIEATIGNTNIVANGEFDANQWFTTSTLTHIDPERLWTLPGRTRPTPVPNS